MKPLRLTLALITLLSPQLAFAGRPCAPYVAPVAVAPQPLTQNNTYFTYQFTTPAVPYAAQGLSVYQAQGLDRALLLDQSRRLAETASQLASQGISGHQNLTYEALSLDAQQQLASDDVLLLREVKSLVQELRANRQGQSGPVPLQASASPLQQFVNANCVQCHNAGTQSGGLDFTNADALDLGTLKAMNAQIKKGAMPKNKPLTVEGRLAWCDVFNDARDAMEAK